MTEELVDSVEAEATSSLVQLEKELNDFKYIAKSIENLASNNIGEVGAQVLAQSLRTNASIRKLEFGHNPIGDEGAKALAKAIESSHTTVLKTVILTSTRTTDTGAPAFGQSFNNKHAHTCVVSDFNTIGTTGIVALASVIQQNDSLRCLCLENHETEIERVGFGPLVNAVCTGNDSLQVLGISGEHEQATEAALGRNRLSLAAKTFVQNPRSTIEVLSKLPEFTMYNRVASSDVEVVLSAIYVTVREALVKHWNVFDFEPSRT